MNTDTIAYSYMESPYGPLVLAGSDAGLTHVCFQHGAHPLTVDANWIEDEKPLREVVKQLRAYFDGKRKDFDLPLAPEGTAFQRAVWDALLTIPCGVTVSYADIARQIGKPNAVRAVGAANGRNPIPIIIPCHRVIGSDGTLTGYGGGLPIKEALLELERRYYADADSQMMLA